MKLQKFTRNKPKKPTDVYAFIDNQNLNVTIQKLGWKIDWKKFREFLAKQYGVTQAFMFIGYMPEYEDMYEKLHELGYNIVLKPTYDMSKPREENEANGQEGEDKRPMKGNVDTELVLWAMKEINNYDTAVIVSGDGDFYTLVEYLESQKKLNKIVTPSWQYSGLFKTYESYIDRADTHRRQLEYRPKRFVGKNRKQSSTQA